MRISNFHLQITHTHIHRYTEVVLSIWKTVEISLIKRMQRNGANAVFSQKPYHDSFLTKIRHLFLLTCTFHTHQKHRHNILDRIHKCRSWKVLPEDISFFKDKKPNADIAPKTKQKDILK